MNAVPYQTYGAGSISVYREQLPSVSRLLSQGMVAAMFGFFVLVLLLLIYYPSPFDVLLGVFLPVFLAYGAGLGLVAALAIWTFQTLTGQQVGLLVRIIIAFVAHLFMAVGLVVFFDARIQSEQLNFWIFAALFTSVSIGLLTGSRLQPWRAFTRGCREPSARQAWPKSLIGLTFRSLTVFGLMECAFALVFILRSGDYQTRYLVISLLIFSYFLMQTIITFAVKRFWLQVTLGLLINAPWLFVLMRFWMDLQYASYLIVIYLSLWKLFAISQFPTQRWFSFLKEELRYYYLID